MAKQSSPNLCLQSPHHHQHHPREWHKILTKNGSSLLWILTISLACTLFFFFHSPYPSPATPFHVIIQDHLNHAWKKGECDLSAGKWVRDDEPPAYTNRTCATVPESKNCAKYGKDQDFVHWRWKPEWCDLPRLEPAAFLRAVRGKKMAFVGDSVARNQMESLLCLLSQVEMPTDMYKDSEDRFRTWYFNSSDFTLMTLWTKFLVEGTERVINGSASGVYDLHIDRMDINWADKIDAANYIVISDAHWFFRKNYLYEDGKLLGCIFCSEANITDLGLNFGIKRVFRTALQHINKNEKFQGVTFLRTFSPAHFENGTWNGGGYCNKTRPSNEEDVNLVGSESEIRNAQAEELETIREKRQEHKRFAILDVTKAMMLRADGHPGTHWNNEWMRGYNDCVHWCLPGVIDMWNDLLWAVVKKHLSP